MQVDILFPQARVYHVSHVDVVLGEKFSLIARYKGPVIWFADNDPVLLVKGSGNVADIEAGALGQSTILIVEGTTRRELIILERITVRVVQTVNGNGGDLGLSADPPVLK